MSGGLKRILRRSNLNKVLCDLDFFKQSSDVIIIEVSDGNSVNVDDGFNFLMLVILIYLDSEEDDVFLI